MTPQAPNNKVTAPAASHPTFLQILSHIGQILNILEPIAIAATAPFIKNPQSQAIFKTEIPVAQTLGTVLGGLAPETPAEPPQ